MLEVSGLRLKGSNVDFPQTFALPISDNENEESQNPPEFGVLVEA
jgi:hypothetical protein